VSEVIYVVVRVAAQEWWVHERRGSEEETVAGPFPTSRKAHAWISEWAPVVWGYFRRNAAAEAE
jgi:hypothetical protein